MKTISCYWCCKDWYLKILPKNAEKSLIIGINADFLLKKQFSLDNNNVIDYTTARCYIVLWSLARLLL